MHRPIRGIAGMLAVCTTLAGQALAAQAMMVGPLDIPMQRAASGTAWVPDDALLPVRRHQLGSWELTIHGAAVLQYDDQGGPRGGSQLGSVNWGMAMLSHSLASGMLHLRWMASLEAATLGNGGYPLLLQTGETFQGAPLHDRQHPHDLFMELAALYERAIAPDVGVEIYLAPAGEPALGPVAFMHRPSAQNDPFAPITHHWQDATHITFGVVTLGAFTRHLKLEGSLFNGREPDEDRWNFDFPGRRLDSYAGRLTWNPGPRWSLSGSYGYLRSPDALRPDESIHRASASVQYGRLIGAEGHWSSALVWGANDPVGANRIEHSLLLETDLEPDARNTVFARTEYVQKTGADLALSSVPAEARFDVGAIALGYVREVAHGGGVTVGVGVRGSVNFVPPALASAYGTPAPLGLAVFLRLRPAWPGGMGAMPM